MDILSPLSIFTPFGSTGGGTPTARGSLCPGMTIELQPLDGSGNPALVTGVADGNDNQTLLITAPPSGGAFTLTFNGHTTASIAANAVPPPSYYLWTMTGLSTAHLQQIGITWPKNVGVDHGSCTVYLEVFDGTVVEGAALYAGTMSELVTPSDFSFGVYGDSTSVPWNVIGGAGHSFSTATGTLILRISATYLDQWYLDALQAKDLTTSATTIFDDQGGTLVYFGSDTQVHMTGQTSGDFASVNGTYTHTSGRGMGPGYVATGGAADIQSKLQALSSVGAGNMLVTFQSPSYLVRSVNALGYALQSLITTTEPNVTLTHTQLGGNVPSYSVGGGSFVPLAMIPEWTTFFDTILFNLFQSWPSPQYSLSGEDHHFRHVNVSSSSTGGASGRPFAVNGGQSPAGSLSFSFDRLTAGTYQFAQTYPTGGSATVAAWQIADVFGTVLLSGTVDQTVTPADFTYNGFGYKNIGAAWTIGPYDQNTALVFSWLSAGSSGTVVADGCILTRTSSDQSVTIAGSSTVRLQIPANCVSIASGPIPAQTITLANLAVPGGSLLGTFAAVPKTMLVGNNILPDSDACALYSNQATRIQQPMVALGGGQFVVSNDSDGYPTSISAAVLQGVSIVTPAGDVGGLGKGLAGPPAGLYTVIWDWDGTNAASDVTARSNYNGVVTEVTSPAYHTYTGTTGNIRVYHCTGSTIQFTPDLGLDIHGIGSPDGSGHYVTSIKNLRVYPPDPADETGMTPWGISFNGTSWVPTGTVPTFHPAIAAQLPVGGIVRWMDALSTNNNAIGQLTDYLPVTALSRRSNRIVYSNIVSITEPSASSVPVHFCVKNFKISLVTTSTPHGLYNYAGNVQFSGGGTATYSDSSTVTFNNFAPNSTWVVDATRFLMSYAPPNSNLVMTTPVGAGGYITLNYGSRMPYQEIAQFQNQFQQHLHWNIPVAEVDASTTAIFAYFAANLNSGLKVYAEFGNELWNSTPKSSYSVRDMSYQYLLAHGGSAWSPTNTGGSTDETYQIGMVSAALTKFALARAAYTAASRDPTQVIRVVGTSGDPNGSGAAILDQCVAQGLQFELYGPSMYFDNIIPGDITRFTYIDATKSVGHSLDQYEAITRQGYVFQIVTAQNIAQLRSHGFMTQQLINYEGSTQVTSPNNSLDDPIGFAVEVGRHPRMYRIQLAMLQAMQDGGAAASLQYTLNGNPFQIGGEIYENWTMYSGWSQAPGTGTSADTFNLNSPHDAADIVSETGGAQRLWASLVGGGSPATTYTAPASPTTVAIGSATTATITPNGIYTGTITGTPSGSAATGLSPIVRTFSGSATPQTASWTPTVAGTLTITWTNNGSLTNPSNDTITVTAAGIAAGVLSYLLRLRRGSR